MRQIERLALQLLADYPAAVPVDVTSIVEHHGIAIERHPFSDQINGFYTIINGQPVITVNSNHALVRQRFTLAHELYHHLTDGIQGNLPFAASVRSGAKETKPDRFAAALLMPRCAFSLAYKKVPLARLAQMFLVSEQAAEWRAKELGLVAGYKVNKAS